MYDDVKIFSVLDGEETVAARSAQEASDYYMNLCGIDSGEVQCEELSPDDLMGMPFEYENEQSGEIETRTFAEQFAMSKERGMVIPCVFSSTDWR